MSRSTEVPPYETTRATVDARLYNLWRRARLRLALPLRFPLKDYYGLIMLIDNDEWLLANEKQYDLPVICWREFRDQGRDALHTPVECTLLYYHYGARRFRQPALSALESELRQCLQTVR
ncbi:MAG TPA: hypothetical protein ENK26_06925 [Gammaproteobacteria bacterium]|nr:hypothetical protein [Gammaproteobacteria bacterium]